MEWRMKMTYNYSIFNRTHLDLGGGKFPFFLAASSLLPIFRCRAVLEGNECVKCVI